MSLLLTFTREGKHWHLPVTSALADLFDQGFFPEDLYRWCPTKCLIISRGDSGYSYFHMDYDRKLIFSSNPSPWELLAIESTESLECGTWIYDRQRSDSAIGRWTSAIKNVQDLEDKGWFWIFEVRGCPRDYDCPWRCDSGWSIERLRYREEQRWWRQLKAWDYLFQVGSGFLSVHDNGGRFWPVGARVDAGGLTVLLDLGEEDKALDWLRSHLRGLLPF